ncbi:AMP-dependent synthetase/ligase [Mycobacterium intracellulare]|uniref:Long-chain fatty acid--CoA ligase n=1 Tax=Mycobacterium intracellulare subsp. chimaera TaxID=222805 RepID=A0A7U5MKF7_MYCIT|nr:long-chain fatty acid--CoA ligase [Mycobacterium intracellulare]ASL15147.1 long-chain-fatty-acid-CoA ligase, FadD11 [Mycobacterium intracellulare subsp. chimaera]ASQ86333.1 long-chain fatty acid--CoA ligase [Mycobacterium intracellulare subsp. chimaera]MCF1811673.1 long-chain fatty acid--CoA ligase [Mycobacterium intracellulare subsp. intracellulare]MDM3926265.1 long-chain fatty acid--CoA ligase [Mycobacterium intracellulare subsp. chimaera]MDS0333216.1 long-chain fatty acid--CoA ligase [My
MTALHISTERPDFAKIENRAPSVAQMFLDRVAATPNTEAFRYPQDQTWESVTWQQVGDRVSNIAGGLIALGIAPEDRIALASSTRYEWVLIDFAVMCAGAATTTVYPTTNDSDTAYILANSGSRVVVAENQIQLDKLLAHRAELPDVDKVVMIDGNGDGDWVIALNELEQLGKQLLTDAPDAVTKRVAAVGPEHLASLIYTSGTTGRPKGVRLTHGAWTYTAAAIDALGILGPDDLNFLWLPLAHAFGKVMLALPLQVGFPTAIDGRAERIVDNLAALHPTIMGAAPRIFEKAHARVQAMVAEQGRLRKKMFDWSIAVGLKVSAAHQAGKRPSLASSLAYKVADRMVLSTIRQRFGGRLRFFVSAAAALDRDVAQWFDAVGIVVLEGYGLTETAAASFINRPDAYRFGTVGWPFPATEVKIADDGEILLRGPGLMTAYHDLPDATAEALAPDGWFRTGDVGEIDADGFLRITDRKKDMFKTSQGKYVAPSAIDARFKGLCPYVSELLVYGEARPYCVALVGLDAEAITDWAGKNGMANEPLAEIARDQKTRDLIAGYFDVLNSQLNRWERIKNFAIADRELSVEAGDLTPSLKLRRKAVIEKFADRLSELYGSGNETS